MTYPRSPRRSNFYYARDEYRTPPQSPSPFLNSKNHFFPYRVAPPTSSLRRAISSSTGTTKKYRSSPSRPYCNATHIPSTIPGSGGQLAPGAETMGQTQILKALGTPFVLERLFGNADAEAMEAKSDSEQAAGAMGMDVEDARRTVV